MSHREVYDQLREHTRADGDVTLDTALEALEGSVANGRPITLSTHPHAVPYLDHVVEALVDGPPTSSVVAVISARLPTGGWRRFTLSRSGPWQYVLEVFPSIFGDANAPLAPGIPPSATRRH